MNELKLQCRGASFFKHSQAHPGSTGLSRWLRMTCAVRVRSAACNSFGSEGSKSCAGSYEPPAKLRLFTRNDSDSTTGSSARTPEGALDCTLVDEVEETLHVPLPPLSPLTASTPVQNIMHLNSSSVKDPHVDRTQTQHQQLEREFIAYRSDRNAICTSTVDVLKYQHMLPMQQGQGNSKGLDGQVKPACSSASRGRNLPLLGYNGSMYVSHGRILHGASCLVFVIMVGTGLHTFTDPRMLYSSDVVRAFEDSSDALRYVRPIVRREVFLVGAILNCTEWVRQAWIILQDLMLPDGHVPD
eukprot:366410-Chlamydomonas_euryale.AAC.9